MAKKSVRYFDSHLISVLTYFLQGEIVNKQGTTRHIDKWEKLMPYDITYTPHIAIKSQALADFVVEWTEAQAKLAIVDLAHWNMYFDESLMLQGAVADVVLVSPSRNCMRYVPQLCFEGATNNLAEEETLLHR